MSDILKILEEFRSEGELDSTGQFTLDSKKAREKMKKYQLIDPHYYVLELIQAACAGNATAINVYVDSDDCKIQFDGEPFDKDDFDNMYSSLFTSQHDIRLDRFRELAIAVNSAMGLNPRFIEIISGDGEKSVSLTMTPPSKESIKEYSDTFKGTKIHIKERISWDTARKFFSSYIARQLPTEAKVIRTQCIYCKIPIKLNGELINPPEKTRLGGVLFEIPLDMDHCSGRVGIPSSPYKLSHLQILKWGVIINSRSTKLGYLPIIGYIEANKLIKNASQSDLVENEVFKTLMKDLSNNAPQLLEKAVDMYIQMETNPDEKTTFALRDIIIQALRFEFRVDNYLKSPEPILEKIAPLRLFTTTDGKLISLQAIVDQFKKTGFVPYSQRCFVYPHPDNLTVLLIQDKEGKNLIDVMFKNRKKDVEADFGKSMVREHHMGLWRARKTEQISLIIDTLCQRTFADGSIYGVVGIAQRNPDDFCRIFFYRESGLICEKNLDLGGVFFDAAVNNDKLNPVYTWDDIETDAEFVKTMQAILMQLHNVYGSIASQYTNHLSGSKEVSEPRRVHLIRYMALLLKNTGQEPDEKSTAAKNRKPRARVFNCRIGQTVFETKRLYSKSTSENIEIPDMGLSLPEEFLYLKVFHTVSNGMVSLNDLQKSLEKYFKVHFIRKDISSSQMDDRIIVIIKDREEEILKRYFGWYKVEDYDKGFQQEQEALKNLNKPAEEPEIKEETVIKVPVKYVEIFGEVGLLSKDDPDSYAFRFEQGKKIPVITLPVRILKFKRPVTTVKIELPIHALTAEINFDKVTVNKAWSQVLEDEMFKEIRKALLQGIKNLAASAIAASYDLQAEENFRIRRFLLEYAGFWLGRIDYQKKDPSETELQNSLMSLRFFKTTEPGFYASLEDLLDHRNRFGKIAFVANEVDGNLGNERIIPVLNPFEEEIVRSVMGKDCLEDVEKIIRDNKIAEYIKKSKAVHTATISIKDPLIKISINEDGITGEIGLPRSGSPGSTGSLVKILKEFRSIAAKSFDFPIRLEACINYDRLTPTPNWSNVIEDTNYKKVLECLKRQSFKLITALYEKYPVMSENDKAEAEACFLAYLVNSFTTYSDILRSKSDSFVMKLATLPMIPVLGGGKTSMSELIEYYNANKKIPYVSKPNDIEPPADGEMVAVLNGNTMALLKKLFYHFRECSQDLQLRKIADQNMMKPPVESLTINEDYIYKVAINKAGMKGELALPAQYLSSEKIIFTKKMIPVVEKSLYPQSRVFGILESTEFKTDRVFTDIVLFQSEKRAILEYIYKLYDGLAEELVCMDEGSRRETARQLLLSFYLEQKFQVQTEFRIMENRLEKKIGALPLLPISDGRYAGIEVALNSVERLGYIGYIHTTDTLQNPVEENVFRFDDYDFDYNFCVKMTGPHRLKYQKELLTVSASLESLSEHEEGLKESHVETCGDLTLAPVDNTSIEPETEGEKIRLPEAEPVRKEADLSPEQKLLFAIKREFRLIRETGDYKLSDEILRGMDICRLSGKPPVLFSKNDAKLLINTIHPLIGSITGRVEDSPESVYYLLSVIYSTINRELREIEDSDELAFQMVMLDHLLKPLKTSNQKPDSAPV